MGVCNAHNLKMLHIENKSLKLSLLEDFEIMHSVKMKEKKKPNERSTLI